METKFISLKPMYTCNVIHQKTETEERFFLEYKGLDNSSWYSAVVKMSQLTVWSVDLNVHTGALLTGFYYHFDHPQQYKTMLLPVKNGRLILTCKCTYYT